jgi:hypothetical protein
MLCSPHPVMGRALFRCTYRPGTKAGPSHCSPGAPSKARCALSLHFHGLGSAHRYQGQGRVTIREFEGLVPAADVEPGAVGLAEAAQAVLVEGYVPHTCQPHDAVLSS